MRPFPLIAFAALALLLAGCSLDVIPVHSSRVRAAREADKPLARGPGAPGAFKHVWTFAAGTDGIVLDPARIEVRDGRARLRSQEGGKYPTERDRALLELTGGLPYVALDGFAERTGPGHRGQVRYQLSPDGARWLFHDGKAWVNAGPTAQQANTAAELNERIRDFHSATGGPGSLFIKAALVSPTGAEPVELEAIEVQGIAPRTDGWQ
jgi:hypothetical protein